MPQRKKTGPKPLPVPQSWIEPIAGWTADMKAIPRSPNTIATRTDHLRRLARTFPAGPWTVTGRQLINWAAEQNWSREMTRSTYAPRSGRFTAGRSWTAGSIPARPRRNGWHP